GLATAVEHRVKPVVALETLGGLVLVGGQADLAHSGTTLDFDEPDLDGRPRVFGVGPARDQVKAPVLGLDALDLPSPRFLVANHELHRNPLDVGVLDHGREPRRGTFGVGKNPGTADVNDVGDGTMPLPLEFKKPL